MSTFPIELCITRHTIEQIIYTLFFYRENELLWREVASLRQKHSKQQQIVNKLIQFLIHLVRGRSGLGMNLHRKRPLMLSDSNQVSVPPAKMKKYVKTSELPMYSVQSVSNHGKFGNIWVWDNHYTITND